LLDTLISVPSKSTIEIIYMYMLYIRVRNYFRRISGCLSLNLLNLTLYTFTAIPPEPIGLLKVLEIKI